MNNKDLEDKIEEVTEQEFALHLNQTLTTVNVQMKALRQRYDNVSTIVKNIEMYKALNFKIKYYWDNEKKVYSYKYFTKEKAGFIK